MDSLSHISFSVSDFKKSLDFYDAVLGAIGHKRAYLGESGAGWGPAEGREFFEIKKRVDKVSIPSLGFHLAFHATQIRDVHTFHELALVHGGKDNGLPGPRPDYGEGYYAAFVIDPDGYGLEVKLHIASK